MGLEWRMRCSSSLLVLLTAVLTSGCLRSTTTIDLKPDGSGTIVQENAVSAEALAMLKSFAGSQQQGKGGAAPDIFTQEQAMKTAETMGVTFVSGEPIKTTELEGYRARYRFDDITTIKVNMKQTPDGMAAAGSDPPPFGFTFEKGSSSSTLTIQMPDQMPGGSALPGLPGSGGASGDPAQAAQAMSMMKMMMKGLFVDLSLAVDGRIIKSNASHVEGSKVTLLQLDFDKLLQDEANFKKLEAAKDLKAMASIAGLKVSSEPKVVIEFSQR
jgi:hypothetical protein